MKISYLKRRSSFLKPCVDAIRENADRLLEGATVRVELSPRGYAGCVNVTVRAEDSMQFETDWDYSDPSRFPARLKAAATALHECSCYGQFRLSHNDGLLEITTACSGTAASVESSGVRSSWQETEPQSEEKSPNQEAISDEVGAVLQQLPWACWERVIEQDASYQTMRPLAESYPAGAFMALMVLAGLNDYQLKGPAETGYWPPLRARLMGNEVPKRPAELGEVLRPFYEEERLRSHKVSRMQRFLASGLAEELWEMSPRQAADQLHPIWSGICDTMGGDKSRKTTVFAVKCLGMALVMLGEMDFDFFGVPIPVDSRLQKLTPSLADEQIREFWRDVLTRLRDKEPRLTHLHLDTLLWHYLGSGTGSEYLERVGVPAGLAEEVGSVFRRLAAG